MATDFPDLNFIVDHCGMPRIDDFCFVAGQEPNVYGGLALVASYINARPRHFARMMSDLLFFVGPDRLLFGSDYAITSPNWIIETFMEFEFDDETAHEAGTQLTLDVKRKIWASTPPSSTTSRFLPSTRSRRQSGERRCIGHRAGRAKTPSL